MPRIQWRSRNVALYGPSRGTFLKLDLGNGPQKFFLFGEYHTPPDLQTLSTMDTIQTYLSQLLASTQRDHICLDYYIEVQPRTVYVLNHRPQDQRSVNDPVVDANVPLILQGLRRIVFPPTSHVRYHYFDIRNPFITSEETEFLSFHICDTLFAGVTQSTALQFEHEYNVIRYARYCLQYAIHDVDIDDQDMVSGFNTECRRFLESVLSPVQYQTMDQSIKYTFRETIERWRTEFGKRWAKTFLSDAQKTTLRQRALTIFDRPQYNGSVRRMFSLIMDTYTCLRMTTTFSSMTPEKETRSCHFQGQQRIIFYYAGDDHRKHLVELLVSITPRRGRSVHEEYSDCALSVSALGMLFQKLFHTGANNKRLFFPSVEYAMAA